MGLNLEYVMLRIVVIIVGVKCYIVLAFKLDRANRLAASLGFYVQPNLIAAFVIVNELLKNSCTKRKIVRKTKTSL